MMMPTVKMLFESQCSYNLHFLIHKIKSPLDKKEAESYPWVLNHTPISKQAVMILLH